MRAYGPEATSHYRRVAADDAATLERNRKRAPVAVAAEEMVNAALGTRRFLPEAVREHLEEMSAELSDMIRRFRGDLSEKGAAELAAYVAEHVPAEPQPARCVNHMARGGSFGVVRCARVAGHAGRCAEMEV
jgi:hypothetical protein